MPTMLRFCGSSARSIERQSSVLSSMFVLGAAMSDQNTRRPVQPDDLFRLKLIQGAALAPDGSSVVYALAQTADDGEDENIALWLQPVAGGAARQLTAGHARDFAPRFSPDGRQVAFVSTRGDK